VEVVEGCVVDGSVAFGVGVVVLVAGGAVVLDGVGAGGVVGGEVIVVGGCVEGGGVGPGAVDGTTGTVVGAAGCGAPSVGSGRTPR
jgi:hypothetical protein